MLTDRMRALLLGAGAGGLLGLLLMALFAGRFALGSVDATVLAGTGRARSEFVVSSGGLYALAIVTAIIAGVIIAAVGYAIGRESDPEAPRFPIKWLVPVGVVTAVVIGYAMLRAGLGALADINAGLVTVSVFRMALITLVAGVTAGGITAYTVDALARPDLLGEANEAWPTSPLALAREAADAIGIPALAAIAVAGGAIGLSQILLSLHGTAVVVVFSVVAAIILGIATLLAYRPWDTADQG